jgi:GNAT superfamily N-acetyltransferase
MDIRQLSHNDLPALLLLYRDLHGPDEALASQNMVDSVWAEIMATDRCVYFGGFVGVDLVTSCTIAIIPNLTRRCRPYGVIENVVTAAALRRRGYATAVLRTGLSYAWAAGCYKVMLMTGRKDEATLRFYRLAGFDANEKQAFIARPAA